MKARGNNIMRRHIQQLWPQVIHWPWSVSRNVKGTVRNSPGWPSTRTTTLLWKINKHQSSTIDNGHGQSITNNHHNYVKIKTAVSSWDSQQYTPYYLWRQQKHRRASSSILQLSRHVTKWNEFRNIQRGVKQTYKLLILSTDEVDESSPHLVV